MSVDLGVGWPCPVCVLSKDRIVTMIDWEFDKFGCGHMTSLRTTREHTMEELIVARAAQKVLKYGGADPRFPHRCPKCGQAAYVGLNQIEHRTGGCK